MEFTYLKTPLNRYTFKNKKIKVWVESKCEGLTLNLFAGKTILNIDEVRNDLNLDMPADYHLDALEFVEKWSGEKFGTILLDPPYSFRKSMEMYSGKVMSPFNALKNAIPRVLVKRGVVITLGYHSVVMGQNRGFFQEHLMVMSHGGAIHDILVIIERSLKYA